MIPFGDREVPRCLLSQIGETHSISEVRKDAHQTNLHPLASLEAEFGVHRMYTTLYSALPLLRKWLLGSPALDFRHFLSHF